MDQTPTVMFDSYESDFKNIIAGAADKLEGSGKNLLGEQRKAALRKAEIELDEADDIIAQLDIEIQGIPQSIRTPYTSRLKTLKSELSKYKKISKESKTLTSRFDLLSSSPSSSSPSPYGRTTTTNDSDDPYGERRDRNRLLKGTETLTDSSRRIQDSTGLALETEAYGADILRTLRGQREQIENSRNMLDTTDTHIERASGTLKNMIRHMKRQRYIYTGIGVFFVVMVLTILYFKLFR